METMNDLQLLKTLELYLDDTTYDYAVMIDGPWGCGKSYFLKEKFFSELDRIGRKYIFISLYGMSSINDINKQVYLQNIVGNEKVDSKSRFFGFAGSLLFDYLDKKGIDVDSVQSAIDLVKEKISINENTVLIFDDLERTKINVAELLGFINGFVEQQHLKTIIICNEQELEDSLDNLELKYLLASKDNILFSNSLSDRESFKDFSRYSDLDNKDDDNSRELIGIEELKNRVNELFDEKTKYKKIKEKVVGNTFYYSCDLKDACLSILNTLMENVETQDIKNRRFFELMENNILQLADEMQKFNHLNLRTFQFFLSKMFQFYQNLLIVDSTYIELVFKDYILFALKESIRYKCGEDKIENLNCVESEISNYITGKTIMNNAFVDTIMQNYRILTSKGKIETSINIIYTWSENNSIIINDALNYLKEHVEEINHVYYKRLLTSLAINEYYDILDSNDIDNFIDSINEQLFKNKNAKQIIYELKYTFLELQQEKDIYARYLNKLTLPKNKSIENPFEKWIYDTNYRLCGLNGIDVFDTIYLNEENIDKIYSSIISSDKALPIWNFYHILNFVFLENFSIWNNSYLIDRNLYSINILLEKLSEYAENNESIDKVIKFAIQKLVFCLNNIKAKYKSNPR